MMTLSLVFFFLMRVNKPKGFRSFSSSILFGSQMTYFNPRIKAKQSKTQNWKLMDVWKKEVLGGCAVSQCAVLVSVSSVSCIDWSLVSPRMWQIPSHAPTSPAQPSPAPAQPSRGAAVNVIVKICPCYWAAAWPSTQLNSALLQTLGFLNFDIHILNKHFEPVLVCCGSFLKTHKQLCSCYVAVR